MSKTSRNPIEQNSPSEANRSSTSEEKLRILLNTESSLWHSKKLVTLPYRMPDQAINAPISLLEDTV
jgi:hypothetical protein